MMSRFASDMTLPRYLIFKERPGFLPTKKPGHKTLECDNLLSLFPVGSGDLSPDFQAINCLIQSGIEMPHSIIEWGQSIRRGGCLSPFPNTVGAGLRPARVTIKQGRVKQGRV